MQLWKNVRKAFYNPPDSIRPSYAELGRRFNLDPRIIKKMTELDAPPGYRMKNPRPLKVLAPHLEFIEQLLFENIGNHRKQKLSATRIYEIIYQERNYRGSVKSVSELVRKLRRHNREVYVPLLQPMSCAQVDFYEVYSIVEGIERKVYCFNMTLSYSDAVFSMSFPFQKREAWLEGHRQAFIFFGGVPAEIIYDNDSALVAKMLTGHERKTTDEFQRLQCFYCFDATFCNAYSGHEKGIVENANKYLQQHFFTPYPRVRDLAELNFKLYGWCAEFLKSTAKGKDKSRGELLAEEQRVFIPLPKGEFDACVTKPRDSDKMALVNFDNNRYSVPDSYAHYQELIVKGFWDRVEIHTRNGELLAKHQRLYDKHLEALNPLHYLTTLEKKPGVFDYGKPFADFELPSCFQVLRDRLESEAEIEAKKHNPDKVRGKGGKYRGTREFVRVVKLLSEFSLASLTRAVKKSLRLGHPEYEVIRQYCFPEEAPDVSLFSLAGREHLASFNVDKPKLINYESLLGGSDYLDCANKMEEQNNGKLGRNDSQTTSIAGALSQGTEALSDTTGLQSSSQRLPEEENKLLAIPETSLREGVAGEGGTGCGETAQSSEVCSTQNY